MEPGDPLHQIRENAHILTGSEAGMDDLMEAMGDSRFVLLGEASHGTHEFYQMRARITQRLIEEKGFTAVAVEADWPDAWRINRYVQGKGDDRSAVDALASFKRFPSWMWRNGDVVEFIQWLRSHNDRLPQGARKAGFYGLDLYSLHASARAVLDFLDKVDPEGARRARYRYSCFEDFGEDTQAYGYAASFGLSKSCEDEAVNQLVELRRRAAELANGDGKADPDDFFAAEQNARLVTNAERYYRVMFQSNVESWNLRDQHMFDTLQALVQHLGNSAKVAVWAHNSHLGQARATEMGKRGELNIGQLVHDEYGRAAMLVGFTTYRGTVTAASSWDGSAERKHVRAALPGSYEELFHQARLQNFFLNLRREARRLPAVFDRDRLERAIGVIYRPESERVSHYFHAMLASQFDIVIHLDETTAVEPLERTSQWEAGEVPETYPFAV